MVVYSQNNDYGNISGTHIIVAKCIDGIIVASDSRFSIFETINPKPNETPDAYSDGVKKIYIIKDFVFVYAHLGTVNDTIMGHYFKEFSKGLVEKDSLSNRIKNWETFISQKPDAIFKQFQSIQLIAAKYENKQKKICIYFGGKSYCDVAQAESGRSIFDSLYSKNNSWRETEKHIRAAMKGVYKDKPFTVGGDIVMLLIKPNNKFRWLTKEPKEPSFLTVSGFWKDYKKGKVNLHFTSDEAKKRIEKYLKTIN